MPYSDDPLRDFDAWDAEQSAKLRKLPVCDVCDNSIQHKYYYEIYGEIICPTCLEFYFRKENDQ